MPGFSLTEERDPTRRDILRDDATTTMATAPVSAEVKLIRPARLPAGHSKIVRVEVSNSEVTGEMCLFEPATQELGGRGLTMADALVGVGEKMEATLVVANTSVEPVLLEEGDVIGSLQPCTLVPAGEAELEDSPDGVSVSAVLSRVDEEQDKQLWDALEIDALGLQPDDRGQLASLLTEFAHLFAMDNSDLGQTFLVTHTIKTGDSPPIRWPPRRIPFALRG